MIRRTLDASKRIELRAYIGGCNYAPVAAADDDSPPSCGGFGFLLHILSSAKYNPDFLVPQPNRCWNLRPKAAKKLRLARKRAAKRKLTKTSSKKK